MGWNINSELIVSRSGVINNRKSRFFRDFLFSFSMLSFPLVETMKCAVGNLIPDPGKLYLDTCVRELRQHSPKTKRWTKLYFDKKSFNLELF